MSKHHDDEPFSEDEMANTLHGHAMLLHERLTGDEKHGEAGEADDNDRGVHYERVPIRGAVPHGGFRLSNDAVNRLGGGDPRTSGAVLHSLFGTGASDDPRVIPPDVVRRIGHGDLGAGTRVLRRLVQMLHRGKAHDSGRAA